MAADLVSQDQTAPPDPFEARNAAAFVRETTRLLERAGRLSLAEAAARLGVTPRALHQRILDGEAIGVMKDGDILVPEAQFTVSGGKTEILPGIGQVTRTFLEAKAGGWSELQFLLEHDPNLGITPLEALRLGRVDDVVRVARFQLALDEGTPIG